MISPCTPLAAQSRTTSCTDSAGTATIATSTSPGMSPTVEYAGRPGHRLGRRVHDVHPAGVVAEDEVAHQRLADRVLPPGRADHRDRARVEELLDRGRLGAVLAAGHDPDRGVGRLDRELEGDDAVLEAADQPVAGVAEGLDHPVVVREHLGHEPLDAALAAGLGEVLEQQLADAAALLGVLDQERDLGDLGRRRVRVGVVGRTAPRSCRARSSGPTAASRTRPGGRGRRWVKRAMSRSDRCGIGEKNR